MKIFFVGVFESKVEGLCGEVPHHVDHIATPETQETLLFLNTTEAVDDPLVSFLLGDELLGILNLQEDLNSLKGGHHRL